MKHAELIVDCRNVLGESVTWNDLTKRLLWLDIESRELWSLNPSDGMREVVSLPERMACFGLRRDGTLVAGFASGFAYFDPATGARRDIAPFEPDIANTRLNDGRVDRRGRFVAGGFDEVEGQFISSVVRLDPNGRVTPLFGGVACANGLCFSPDGKTMYFADSPARTIWAFDYAPDSGTVTNRRELVRGDDAVAQPDGSCVDADGCVWSAQWNGHRVVRYTPDGRVDRVVPVPVLNPTCVAFGGANLDVLYITTARYRMSAEELAAEPTSGGLYAFVAPGIRGVSEPFFGA